MPNENQDQAPATEPLEKGSKTLSPDQAAELLQKRRAEAAAGKEKKPAKAAEDTKEKETVTPDNKKSKGKESAADEDDEDEDKNAKAKLEKDKAKEKAKKSDTDKSDDEDGDESDDESKDDSKQTRNAGDDDGEIDPDDLDPDAEIPIKVGDKVENVKLGDLIKAHRTAKDVEVKLADFQKKEADFTTKEQVFTEGHKAAAAELDSLAQAFHQALGQDFKGDGRYSKETMDAIRSSDPAEWNARMTEINMKNELLNRARDLNKRNQEKAANEQKQRFESYAKNEAAELKKHYPNKSSDELTAHITKVGEWLKSEIGFAPEQVDGIVEAKIWRVADLAYQASNAKSSMRDAANQVRTAPKLVRPGGRTNEQLDSAKSKYSKTMDRLRKGGKMSDGVAALQAKREANSRRS